jgi:TolB-like protein
VLHVRLCFGDYILDSACNELTRGSDRVAIGPQAFDLLVYLVLNRDRVLSKEDLLQAIWGGRVVSDSTLTSHINAVRKAVGDSGEQQALIRTIPRKGYRFIGHVTDEHTTDRLIGDLAEQEQSLPTLLIPDKPSIAVLAFQNLSGDPDQDYFADGMVEDIITALSRLPWLFVIARNSSFTYKGRAVDVKQVGRQLGVRYVLEASVRKAAGRVRVTTQLVEAATRAHLWAERFEGTIDAVFDLQDQVAASVCRRDCSQARASGNPACQAQADRKSRCI